MWAFWEHLLYIFKFVVLYFPKKIYLNGIIYKWPSTFVFFSYFLSSINMYLTSLHISNYRCIYCCSVNKLSDSLRLHELQHARLPCPSQSPGVCPSSCLLNRWCHLANSCSVISFSSWPQSFQKLGSFTMSPLVTSGGQGIGVSASSSVLPMCIRGWYPLRLTNLILLHRCIDLAI